MGKDGAGKSRLPWSPAPIAAPERGPLVRLRGAESTRARGRGGAGSRRGAAGRGTCPAGARSEDGDSHARTCAPGRRAPPRSPSAAERRARSGSPPSRGRALVTSAFPTRVPESRAGSAPSAPARVPSRRPPGPAPQTPFSARRGRVLAAHAGWWGPAPPRQFPGRPAGHHGGPEACAAAPGGLTGPERGPWHARGPGRSPAPWPGPSLPA